MKKIEKTNPLVQQAITKAEDDLPGYPSYPSGEDIYGKLKEEENIDPADILKTKAPNDSAKFGKNNEKDFEEDESGDDLDVPGSELDDEPQIPEDEENSYYSLGGDYHNDLDEDKGD